MADLTPQRIVSLQPSATSILAELGELDRIVACTKYCLDVCPEVSGRTIVPDSWTAQAEQIRAVRPDLVIAAVPYQLEAVGEILKAGIRFLGLAPKTLADIYTDIATIAGIVAQRERGEEVIRKMQDAFEQTLMRTSGLPQPRVYCEEWGRPLIHSQAWVMEAVTAAGGEFVGTPASQTTAQEVGSANPEVMIFAWCGAGDRVPLAKIIEERGWGKTAAVRHKSVYCVPDEWLNTPAPTLLQGLRAVAACIHPEKFPLPDRVKHL